MSARSLAVALLALAGAAVLYPGPVRAQQRLASANGPAATRPPREPDPEDLVVAPPVRVPIPPRAFRVATVEVPASVPPSLPISYEVIGTGSFTLLGPTSGIVPAARSGPRTVLLTIGVPAHARAGRTRALVVRFTTGWNTIDVPLDVDVEAIRGLKLSVQREVRGAAPGERFSLPVHLVNLGNLADTVTLDFVLPDGWRARVTPASPRFVIGPASVATRVAHIQVPRSSNLGGFMVRVRASSGGAVRADEYVLVQVGQDLATAVPPGPTLRTSLASATDEGGGSARAFGLALNGEIAPEVHVDGRAVAAVGDGIAAQRGMVRLGVYNAPAFLSLSTPDWNLELGTASVSFGELTGANGWGRGAGLHYKRDGRALTLLAAGTTPLSRQAAPGQLLGATLGLPVLGGSVSGSVVELEDGDSLNARRLSAAGLGLSSPATRFGTLSGELAYRRFGDGAGTGWSTLLERQGNIQSYRLELVHAPGGSSAFARARDEWSASAERQLASRWRVGLNMTESRDSTPTFSGLHTASFSIQQQLALTEVTSLALEAGKTSFSATPQQGNGSYGDDQLQLSLGLNQAFHALILTGRLATARVDRRVSFDDGLDSDIAGTHISWVGGAVWASRRGVFQAEGGYDLSTQQSGYLPRQGTLRLKAAELRAPFLPQELLFSGEVLRTTWGTYRDPLTSYRVGASLMLGGGLELAADAERDPLYRIASGTVPWLFTIKLERATRLPRLGWGGSSGVVYQDLNGNGRRDHGEPGIGGITVARNGVKVHTRADGRYRFPDRAEGTVRVDPTTLPEGSILEDRPEAEVRRDIPVVSTAVVEVTLVLRPDSVGHRPRVDLLPATVYARDGAGREWEARRPSAESAVFDALPVGEYTLVFDASGLSEPLRIDGKAPVVVVRGRPQQVMLPLVGRRIRIFRPEGGADPGKGHS